MASHTGKPKVKAGSTVGKHPCRAGTGSVAVLIFFLEIGLAKSICDCDFLYFVLTEFAFTII